MERFPNEKSGEPQSDPGRAQAATLPATLVCRAVICLVAKWFRRLVTRYEYPIENFLGMVRLDCVGIMLRYLMGDYSYRSATMGSIFAARRAAT
jgi:hypothetical protein